MPQEILYGVLTIVHLTAIVSMLTVERRQPTATLAWLVTLIFMPLFGPILYLLIGRTRAIHVVRQRSGAANVLKPVLERHSVHRRLRESPGAPIEPRTQQMLRLGDRLASTPASHGNDVKILIDGRATYAAMLDAILAAREHIHVEFYIVQPDETGRRLRDTLTQRAREGVEVRVVCDGIGSARLPRGFFDPLVEAGGKFALFRPAARVLGKLPWRDRFDFRNHRKLIITDGRVGFTGGINVGREYLGLDPEFGYWRDTHVRIEGPSVLSLQKVFAEDWLYAADELLDDARYFPEPPGPLGDSAVQVVDSGPDRVHSPISYIFSQSFALACERIWITNPYFIPNPAVEEGLIAAALRGVDVRLLVPKRSDSTVVKLASASYYPALIEAGARIFRYARGFVHAKTMVIDEWLGTVGSANMDVRSFHLNYELNAFVYGRDFCQQLARQFLIDLQSAEELTEVHERRLPRVKRVLRAGARLLSPLL